MDWHILDARENRVYYRLKPFGKSELVMMQINDSEFARIRDLVYARCGINLSDKKKLLVINRLQKAIRHLELDSFEAYYQAVISDHSGELMDELINQITTNHTFFYRENSHFEYLSAKVLPEWKEKIQTTGKLDFRMWCAGCSSGEEAYVLAMLQLEFFGSEYSRWNAGLLATDISARVLNMAREGEYDEERVAGLPPILRKRYFEDSCQGVQKIRPALQKEITFRRFNLMHDFPFKKPFHVIFCRNVMIYFDQETRENLVQKFHDFLYPGGYLFIGMSETLNKGGNFDYVIPSVYRKK